MENFEVIVVGAGIAGASTAFFLAERGIRTALVEKTHPAGGPTGQSSALTHAFYLMPELSQLAIKGVDTLRRIPELTGEAPVHTQVGCMWACGAGAKPLWIEAARRINTEGSVIEELSATELARHCPDIDLEGIELALWEPQYGYADPYGATNAIAKGAKARGAKLMLSTTVKKLVSQSGKVVGVELQDNVRLGADKVVVAAGPWTRPLIAALGYDLPIWAERHEMAVVDARGHARDFMPFAWVDDLLPSYARPDGDRVVLAGVWAGGGTGLRNEEVKRPLRVENPDVFNTGLSDEESANILSVLLPRFPKIAELGIRPGYAALYDMSPDDNPLIGPVPGVTGLYVICGSSGHGFKLGAGVGEEVARLVTTGRAPLLSPFKVDRFN
jgi:sarcosine oxidase subunit beta